MADRFDRFEEEARRVLSLAHEEAQHFNHNYVGTEHLLLGLVRERDGLAAKVLANLGVELNKVRSAVEFIIGRGDRPTTGEAGLTPRAKKVIELTLAEARRLNHHSIGTEHLLLGLLREGEGIAAGVLESLGVTLEKVRKEMQKFTVSFEQQLEGTVHLVRDLCAEYVNLRAALENLGLMTMKVENLTPSQQQSAREFHGQLLSLREEAGAVLAVQAAMSLFPPIREEELLNKLIAALDALDAFNQAQETIPPKE